MACIKRLWCWLFGHKFDKTFEFPHADLPGEFVLLGYCSRCGDGPWRVT